MRLTQSANNRTTLRYQKEHLFKRSKHWEQSSLSINPIAPFADSTQLIANNQP